MRGTVWGIRVKTINTSRSTTTLLGPGLSYNCQRQVLRQGDADALCSEAAGGVVVLLLGLRHLDAAF